MQKLDIANYQKFPDVNFEGLDLGSVKQVLTYALGKIESGEREYVCHAIDTAALPHTVDTINKLVERIDQSLVEGICSQLTADHQPESYEIRQLTGHGIYGWIVAMEDPFYANDMIVSSRQQDDHIVISDMLSAHAASNDYLQTLKPYRINWLKYLIAQVEA